MDMDIIDIIDEEDERFDDMYYRNASFARPRFRRLAARPGSRASGGTAIVRRAQPSRAPIVNSKYGSLKWGLIADAAAKGLAAIQPLPQQPTMGDNATANLQNLADYHAALAGHAKASQQVTTLGAILKVILP